MMLNVQYFSHYHVGIKEYIIDGKKRSKCMCGLCLCDQEMYTPLCWSP